MSYFSYLDLLEMIDSPNKEPSKKLYLENNVVFNLAPGSKTKHQAWPGGYIGHITDSMNIAINQYEWMNQFRDLPFSLSDSLLVLNLHDLEKPFKYSGTKEQKEYLGKRENHKEFILNKIKEYDFKLNEDHLNALKYVHGEGDDYDSEIRIQKPLAAFVSACDNISARIWYNYPK